MIHYYIVILKLNVYECITYMYLLFFFWKKII